MELSVDVREERLVISQLEDTSKGLVTYKWTKRLLFDEPTSQTLPIICRHANICSLYTNKASRGRRQFSCVEIGGPDIDRQLILC